MVMVVIGAGKSSIKRDEEVVFFPTFGYLADDRTTWVVHLHGWIFEPEEDSKVRHTVLELFRQFLGLTREEADTALFKKRAFAFIADNERGKTVPIHFGEKHYTLDQSDSNGHFKGTLRLAAEDAQYLLQIQRTDKESLTFQQLSAMFL